MGPIALFDKSFLQSLSIDESVWFDRFFYPNICPLFYVETLADLTKSTTSSGRTAEDEVRIIADKTPELSGGPCIHHRELCISNLMGIRLPMDGQIPVAGARPVQSEEGHKGVVYDSTPEAQAFTRWQHGDFKEVERRFAKGWRTMLTTLDLAGTAKRMQALGVDSKFCKTVDQAHQIATTLVHSNSRPFELMGLLFTFVDIPHQLHRPILERWSIDQYRPLAQYAPYAAHVLSVELFFQICIAANLISTERASNRIDIGYLFYLPFCMLFTSSDKLHRKCAAPFLRPNQTFVWGQDLKAELGRQNRHFAQLPQSERERGIMNFARSPVGDDDALIIQLWDKHVPGWRERDKRPPEVDSEATRKLVESLRSFTNAPTVTPDPEDPHFADPDRLAIERFVRKKKGNWWVLPEDLKGEDD
ncbi:hypothetical protein [Cupriavidus sp. PET2-C1]